MSWDREGFRTYFTNVIGGNANSLNTYSSYIGRIDRIIDGGLDERIRVQGTDAVRMWARTTNEGPFESYPSNARSTLGAYLNFIEADPVDELADESLSIDEIESVATGRVFKLECDMQAAIRADMGALEPGLLVADGGSEITTVVGRLDILAADPAGGLVIIELKAGACPSGAIEQVLGYAQAIAEDRTVPTRAILIAGSFSDRQRAAARRISDLKLKTYTFALRYADA